MDELISIIVPIYNEEHYLAECLESLRAQKYCALEIILVDDGSTDGTVDICRRYVAEDRRFRYIYQENGGQNAARLTGVRQAKGKWVIFVDSDDFVTPQMCSILMSAQKRTGAEVVSARVQQYLFGIYGRKIGNLSGIFSGNYAVTHFADENGKVVFSHGMCPYLFPRQAAEEALTSIDLRIKFAEDNGCLIWIFSRMKRICFLPDIVYYYRASTTSIMHGHMKSSVFDQMLLLHYLDSIYPNEITSDGIRSAMERLIILNLLLGGYDFFQDYSGIFPFLPDISSGKIAIYGAGVFGEEIHAKLSKRFTVACMFDRAFADYREAGAEVQDPKFIGEYDFDVMLVAIINAEQGERIARELQMLFPGKCIVPISKEILNSEYTRGKIEELRNMDESNFSVSVARSMHTRKR